VQVALSIWYENGTFFKRTAGMTHMVSQDPPTDPFTSNSKHRACSVLAMVLEYLVMLLWRWSGLRSSALPPCHRFP
jgi:hypothetical protein